MTGSYVQPILHIPEWIEAGLANGTLFRVGGVVRTVANGAIAAHLNEVPVEKVSEEALKRLARAVPKIRSLPKAVVPAVVGVATTLVAFAAVHAIDKRRSTRARDAAAAEQAVIPACVTNFEASLRAYVAAGRAQALDAEIVDRLIADLDEVRAWTDDGNAVKFSFQELEPLFNLVIEHTPRLAAAQSVMLPDFDDPEAGSDDGVVVLLRKHLDVQKRIVGKTA